MELHGTYVLQVWIHPRHDVNHEQLVHQVGATEISPDKMPTTRGVVICDLHEPADLLAEHIPA